MSEQQYVDWSPQKIKDFQHLFLIWYNSEKRHLPWRENEDSYRVWVSEIMLQQTRVDTVIPYFLRFLEWFPNIQALAEAPEDKVLKAWEGLGYYSRVRNMQTAAQQIMADYEGKMPADPKEIQKLKGIGPYTMGAIASIAFNEPTPAVDGNVMRVVSRLFEIDEDIAQPKTRKTFEAVMTEIISVDRPGDFNQAMMDLGSSTCTPTNPQCSLCPIQAFCQSYQKGTERTFPIKSKKVKAKPVDYAGLLIKNQQGEFLLQKREDKGLLANMWTFPLLEVPVEENIILGQLDEFSVKAFQAKPIWLKESFAEVTHIFTHLRWQIKLFYGQTIEKEQFQLPANFAWIQPENFEEYVFPTVQQKMWGKYLENSEKF